MPSGYSRAICLTINNYVDEEVVQKLLNDDRFSYIVVGREVGASGTPHLQCYAEFPTGRRWKKLAKEYKAHIEPRRGTAFQASEYCKKDGNFEERGEMKQAGCQMEQERWERAYAAAEKGDFADIPKDLYIRYYSSFHRIHQDSMPLPPTLDVLENEWIWGNTGVGKSRSVRDRCGADLYPKPRNKWWDGYRDQSNVVIEEVCPADAEWLAPFLKLWGDHYPFIGEMKGRSTMIRPRHVFVTSNFSMEQVFLNPQDLEALKRRFKQVNMLAYPAAILPRPATIVPIVDEDIDVDLAPIDDYGHFITEDNIN